MLVYTYLGEILTQLFLYLACKIRLSLLINTLKRSSSTTVYGKTELQIHLARREVSDDVVAIFPAQLGVPIAEPFSNPGISGLVSHSIPGLMEQFV